MKKVKNTIENTLEKDKKDFITVCKIGEVFSVIFLTLCIIGGLLSAFMSVVYMLGIAIDSEFATPHIAEEIYCMVNGVAIMVGLGICCNYSAKVFIKLKTGETPFQTYIAAKIKNAGTVLVITGFFGSVTEFIYSLLLDKGIFLGENTIGIISGCEDPIIFGVVLMALAYIFNYGCKLQQESDETV